MRIILTIITIAILALLLDTFLPWWSVAIAAFLGAFFLRQKNGIKSFFAGLLAIVLVWGGKALLINSANEGMLAEKVSLLMDMQGSFTLILVTALIGGIVGGFAALTGDMFEQLIRPKGSVSN